MFISFINGSKLSFSIGNYICIPKCDNIEYSIYDIPTKNKKIKIKLTGPCEENELEIVS